MINEYLKKNIIKRKMAVKKELKNRIYTKAKRGNILTAYAQYNL